MDKCKRNVLLKDITQKKNGKLLYNKYSERYLVDVTGILGINQTKNQTAREGMKGINNKL